MHLEAFLAFAGFWAPSLKHYMLCLLLGACARAGPAVGFYCREEKIFSGEEMCTGQGVTNEPERTMLTEFGKKLRALRIQHGKTLFDLGGMLNLSTAFLSAVETGRKAVPAELASRIAQALQLSLAEAQDLERAAAKSVSTVNLTLEGRSDRAKELAVAFARRFDSMSDADVKALLENLGSSNKRV